MNDYLQYLMEKYQFSHQEEIERRLLELTSLFEYSQILNATLELPRILNNVLLIPMGRLLIAKGIVVINRDGQLYLELVKGQTHSSPPIATPLVELPLRPFLVEHLPFNDLSSHPLLKWIHQEELVVGVPFLIQEKPLGYAFYGKKLSQSPFTSMELDFLFSLANIAAISIHNALQMEEVRQVNRRLDEKVQQLQTIFEISHGLLSTLDMQQISQLLSYALMGQFMFSCFAFILKTDGNWYVQKSLGYSIPQLNEFMKTFGATFDFEKPCTVHEVRQKTLRSKLHALGIEVIIPMRHQYQLLGYIFLGNRAGSQPLRSSDVDFLTILSNQAVIALENARLFQEALEKQRIEDELKVARQIQNRLLPKQISHLPRYQIFGFNRPSREVGGDYYDVIPQKNNCRILAIGDVTGKSVPAALLMANLQSALRAMVSQETALEKIVVQLNMLIYRNTEADKFITFFVARLDGNKNQLTYVNAGHNPPILVSQEGKVRYLHHGGPLLGVIPEARYELGMVSLHPGDVLIAYTDGLTECLDAHGDEFGEERLVTVVKENAGNSVEKIIHLLVEKASRHAANASFHDDITLLGIKRLQ